MSLSIEQNTQELTKASQNAVSQNNAPYNSRGGNTNTSFTASIPAGTTSTTSSTASA
ncbi:MAG: hypothetical protein ACTHJ7_01415 [Candidatus Nitrosocosmicus sp.]